MRWNRGYESDDVELRGSSGASLGALGLIGVVGRRFGLGGVLLLILFVVLNNYVCGGGGGAPKRHDEAVEFVSFVFDDVQSTWQQIFKQHGKHYEKARLVIYRDSTPTRCGFGSSATGPFYCPEDHIVYIDLSFYDELRRRFGAPGDFAQAYVIAHEVGHHVQNQLGMLAGDAGHGANSR